MLTWKRVIPGRRDESPQTGGLKGLSSMRAAIPPARRTGRLWVNIEPFLSHFTANKRILIGQHPPFFRLTCIVTSDRLAPLLAVSKDRNDRFCCLRRLRLAS